MRLITFLVIGYLFTSLYGCSKSHEYESEIMEEICVWAGETSDISLDINLECHNYKLISDNQTIATAIINKNKTNIHVMTHKSGTTIIRLVDIDSNNTLYKISINALFFSSTQIVEMDYTPNKSEFIIKATDRTIANTIEKELEKERKNTLFSTYTFDEKTKTFTAKTYTGISYKGVYKWDITSLTLICNKIIEKYEFKIAIRRNGYIITDDKTKKYQQRFPNAGITEVKVTRVWRDLCILPLEV